MVAPSVKQLGDCCEVANPSKKVNNMSEEIDEETTGSLQTEGGSAVYTNSTLDCTFPIKVPSSAEEFDLLAGRKGACLEEAIRNVIYRSVNHEFRGLLCDKLEKHTGIEREFKMEGDGEKKRKVFTESEKKYKARLILGGQVDQETCQLFANEIAKELRFDPSPSKRRGGPSKEIQAAVESILQAIAMGQSTKEIVGAKLAGKLGLINFESAYGEFNEASLTAAMVALEEKEKREKVAGLL
jgi:hypothetical protein